MINKKKEHDDLLVHGLGDDQGLALDADLVQEALEGLGLDLLHLQAVDDQDLILLGLGGQGGLESQTADLLVEAVAVIPGLGSEGDAAVVPHRRTCVAGAGAAGALLAPGLLGGVGNLTLGGDSRDLGGFEKEKSLCHSS